MDGSNMEMGLMFDWRISIGTVIEVMSIVGGGLFFLYNMKSRIEVMAMELALVKNELSKLGDILTMIAVQKTRLQSLEEDLKELRHGFGFIVKPPL